MVGGCVVLGHIYRRGIMLIEAGLAFEESDQLLSLFGLGVDCPQLFDDVVAHVFEEILHKHFDIIVHCAENDLHALE